MSKPKPTLEKLPHWPRWLNQCQAAAYVGVSAVTFKKEQQQGLWPAPGRASGKWQLWDRMLLDAASDRLSGLSTGANAEGVVYRPGPNYFDRRLARHGSEPDSPSQRTSGRRRGRKA